MLKHRFNSFRYAVAGIIDLFRTQPNARIHFLFTVLVIAGAWFFEVSTSEWCLLMICIAMVFAAEAFNTAIEYLTDLASPDFHPLAGKAKDAAAGAVLFTALGAAVVGLLVFLPKIFDWFEAF